MIPKTIKDELEAVKYLSNRHYYNIDEMLDEWKSYKESSNRRTYKIDSNVTSLYQRIYYSNKIGDKNVISNTK